MKVELITHTPHALELLLLTKGTRLTEEGKEETLQDIIDWPEEKKLEHLAYMRDTIKSSWEFVDYTFRITGVTRAFTHQFVRTRTGSYAQQAQRVVDLSGATYTVPESLDSNQQKIFEESMQDSIFNYRLLMVAQAAPQDARGVIPTNIHTNIMAKFNLRTLSDMALVRMCVRTQGEYQNVFRAMRDEVIKVHPWAEDFINVHCAATGTCCFPRYTECPIHELTYNHNKDSDKARKDIIKKRYNQTKHESVPKAFKGESKTTDGGC